jgi:hypothetical protein
MNNPGINLEIWERLRKKWAELEAFGHKLKINFQLLSDANDEKNILAIDVIQNVNNEIIIETVQRNAGEAYAALGIAELSMEQLVEVYKKVLKQLHHKSEQRDMDLIVTMTPSSVTSGEIKGYFKKPDSDLENSVLVDYRHYYILNAIREKMRNFTGDSWSMVKAVYHSNDLEFYFEYE